jgi:3-oxoacyl-(acyl-carrier-protein) synthase
VTPPIAITGGTTLTPGGGPLPAAGLPDELCQRIARVERFSALALAAGHGALVDAGIASPPCRERAGIVLGTAFGCFLTNAEYQQRLAAGGVAAASPRLFAATVSNAAAGELGIALGLGGPGITLTSGGVSGTMALGHAANLLAAGEADVLLTGGVDAAGAALTSFIDAGGLAVGGPVSDGAALLVLEPLDLARRRQARVRGIVVAQAAGFEPEPDAADAGDGLADTMRAALAQAGGGVAAVATAASPATRTLVERAVAAVFEKGGVRRLAFGGALGHSLGAAGPQTVLRVLDSEAPGTSVLIVDACASGHVAALIVRVGDLP